MRIVIFGCAGHIGSAILDSDIAATHQITGVDNMSANHHVVLFKQFLKNRIDFIQGDILTCDLDSILKGKDVCINLAAITDAAHSHLHEEEVEAVNLTGAVRVAEACARNNVKMIFLSSTSVYGQANGVVDETCTELKPQSPYAWTKFRAENAFREIIGLKYIVCRFGTIFGVSLGIRFHTFCQLASWQAATRQPITVWRTALDQKRPYLDIKDAVGAIDHIINSNLFVNDIFNVVTSNSTVRDIIDIIKRHRPDAEIALTDSAVMNQLSYNVSCEKFTNTGWTSRGSLVDGLAQEMDWLSGIN